MNGPQPVADMGRTLWIALLAMLVQQTFVTSGKSIVPVIGPAMTSAIGVEPELVGIFVAIASIASTIGAASSGRWIHRLGAMRVSQASLGMVALGLALTATGWQPVIGCGAIILGFGTVMATPASSEILARFAPPSRAALVFSLKQTGVPAGTMVAGFVGPLMVTLIDWRAAVLTIAIGTAVLALALQPLSPLLSRETRSGGNAVRVSVLQTMRETLLDPTMRGLAFGQAAYVGLQNVFTTFFVTFAVVKLNYDLVTAGGLFAAAQMVAVVSRVLWGWLGGRLGGLALLGLLGVAMAAIAVVLGLVTPGWPFWAVAAVALALAGTAVSWQGVMMSEIAHRAGPGMVGAITGGVIAFGSAISIIYPLVMTAVLTLTDSYALCFWLAAAPPFLVGVLLLRGRR